MALVQCKECQEKYGIGFMPTASCSLLLYVPALIAVAVSWVLWDYTHWWAVLWGICTFAATVFGMNWIPLFIEYQMAKRNKCPKCGATKWSFPFTEGFGL
jgi:hypothetical protein